MRQSSRRTGEGNRPDRSAQSDARNVEHIFQHAIGAVLIGLWPTRTQRDVAHVGSGWTVRTKPQAPRSLQYWLTSSFVAGIVCESQEVTHCDSSSQNDRSEEHTSELQSL